MSKLELKIADSIYDYATQAVACLQYPLVNGWLYSVERKSMQT